jgi:TPR repeat protein
MIRSLSLMLGSAVLTLGFLAAPVFAQAPPAAPPGADAFQQAWKLDQGIGTPINMPEAIRLYRQSADAGNALAKARLARIYFSGNTVSADKTEADRLSQGILPDIVKLAQARDPIAQAVLGAMCDDGLGVAQDSVVGMQWMRAAADQNLAMAQYYLGVDYEHGLGVPQDFAVAAQWYGKAAAQGNSIAQAYLGDFYLRGQGVPQNDVEAVRLYNLSAAQNQAHGETNLGWMYEHGRGVAQNTVEGARLYRLAADQNFAVAQANLGSCYERGCGVPQDLGQAVLWYRRAAAQGDRDAIRALRRCGY